MAEEAPKTTTTTTTQEEAVLHAEEVVVVTDVAPADKKQDTATTVVEKNDPEADEKNNKTTDDTTTGEVSKTSSVVVGDEKVPESGSFKEESTRVSDLAENEKKALQDLKTLVQNALNNHEFSAALATPPPAPKEEKPEAPAAAVEAGEEEKNEEEEDKTVKEEEEKQKNSEPVKEAGEQELEQPTKQEEAAAPAAEEVKETEVVAVEKVATVDDDGAKTVEAIEETVVAVSSNEPDQAAPKEEPKQAKEEQEEKKETKQEEQEEQSSSAPKQLLPPEEVSIWGVPLLLDDRSDVILLKFLRARDFKVKEAFTMIKNTIRWRKEFRIEELMDEDLVGDDLEKAVYMHGYDKEGHPVCYNIYGEFQNKELYKKTFSDEEKRLRFLRWRIQFLERSIRKLDFTPGGISTIVQVNDLKNSPGPAKWELRQATKQALQLLQDNYPEFVAKQVFINVPWWYLAVNRMISPFLTQRTKSKFVFAGPSKSAETLLRYIAPEQLPVKYGGLSKDGESGITDAVTEITVRPAAKHTVEFPVTENCLLSWELRVLGWDVSYSAEFVPSSEGSYTVIIQKARKVASSEEPVLCNSYKIGEPGKVVITIDNPSSKKKKLLYRLKTKPSSTD